MSRRAVTRPTMSPWLRLALRDFALATAGGALAAVATFLFLR